jgi:acyl carrier protein
MKVFTKREIIDITTKNIIGSLKATRAQATNPQTLLQYDLDATSFGILDLIINTWEDLGLDFKDIPAVQVHTVGDFQRMVLKATRVKAR